MRLTLIGFGLIVSIIAVEIGLGIFLPSPIPSGKDTFYQPDDFIGWKLIPNRKEGRTVVGKVILDEKINSLGFRDREHSYHKGRDTYRIVVLGDSFCDQLEMPLKQLFHNVLERNLNSEVSKNIEILNLGIGGFGTVQEYLALKYYALKYHPDLVILAFFIGNDVRNNYDYSNSSTAEGPTSIDIMKIYARKYFPQIYYLVTSRVKNTSWIADLFQGLGLIKDGPIHVKKDLSAPLGLHPSLECTPMGCTPDPVNWDYAIYLEQYPPELENGWEITKGLILKIAKELEMNEIAFLVVIISNEFEFRSVRWDEILDENPQMKALRFDLRKPESILSKFLDANNIRYVLLRPEFEKYSKASGKDLHFHRPGDNHWNAEGHALAAHVIYKKLINDKLVPIL